MKYEMNDQNQAVYRQKLLYIDDQGQTWTGRLNLVFAERLEYQRTFRSMENITFENREPQFLGASVDSWKINNRLLREDEYVLVNDREDLWRKLEEESVYTYEFAREEAVECPEILYMAPELEQLKKAGYGFADMFIHRASVDSFRRLFDGKDEYDCFNRLCRPGKNPKEIFKTDNLLLEEERIDPETGELTGMPDDLIHFKSIKQVSLAGAEPIGNKGDTVLGRYLKQYRKTTDKSVTSLGQYVSAPGPTKGSIDSVFSDKSRMMTMSESVMRMTSKSTFDLRDISEKKSAVFIVVHGDKSTYYPFVTMFIEQMYEESMAVARKHGGRMPYPVNCVFDEAGIMPSLKSIDNMVSFGASAGFRLTLAVQDTSQLEHRYGKEKSRQL